MSDFNNIYLLDKNLFVVDSLNNLDLESELTKINDFMPFYLHYDTMKNNEIMSIVYKQNNSFKQFFKLLDSSYLVYDFCLESEERRYRINELNKYSVEILRKNKKLFECLNMFSEEELKLEELAISYNNDFRIYFYDDKSLFNSDEEHVVKSFLFKPFNSITLLEKEGDEYHQFFGFRPEGNKGDYFLLSFVYTDYNNTVFNDMVNYVNTLSKHKRFCKE